MPNYDTSRQCEIAQVWNPRHLGSCLRYFSTASDQGSLYKKMLVWGLMGTKSRPPWQGARQQVQQQASRHDARVVAKGFLTYSPKSRKEGERQRPRNGVGF